MVLQHHLFLKITDNVSYTGNCKDLYGCLTIIDSENIKVNIKNYFEVKTSKCVGLYSNCMSDITSKYDLILCGTEGWLYKTCSGTQSHHIIDKLNYCRHCVEASNDNSNI